MMRSNQYNMIFAGVLSLLLTSSEGMAFNCVQSPDCASLGYTMSATDCKDKIAVKCPTDSSKVFCKKDAAATITPPTTTPEETVNPGNICTDEKWSLYLKFAGSKSGNVCSVKQAESSIVIESSTGKRGSVTEISLASSDGGDDAWTNWAEIILDPGAERIGYIGGGSSYISSFSKTCSQSPNGVEFVTEDGGNYLQRYIYNRGSVKIAWEYDVDDVTTVTCSGDVTLTITEDYSN